MHIIPNVRQRKYAETHDNPDRGKASEMFGGVAYHMRGMMCGAFGAEEARRRQP